MPRALTLRLMLVLAAVFACAAAAIAATGFNRPLFDAVNAAGWRWLPRYLPSCLTLLGNGLAAVMLLALLLERAPQVMAAGLNAAPIAGALSALGKRLAAAPRPAAVMDPAGFHVQGPLLAGHNAFPSGHTITIFLVATVLLLGLEGPRARAPAVLAVLGVAVLVGLSRIMVGAHWPTDVLGGAVRGIASGLAGDALARRWPYWRHRVAGVAFALVVLGCALALAVLDSGYPLALPLQWSLAALGAIAAVRSLVRAARARARGRRDAHGTPARAPTRGTP
jgi:membrane-associated phospholipid phosphatase